MGPEFEKALNELGLRMRMLRAIQEDAAPAGALTERETLFLQFIGEQGRMAVTQIATAWPNVSESTVSMTISKLWRKGLVSKTISPENQRVTLVELTDKGAAELNTFLKHRTQRLQALFDSIHMTAEEKQTLINICQRGVVVLDRILSIQNTPVDAEKTAT
jgi:DNA-binding MarR family transcriptional regulator